MKFAGPTAEFKSFVKGVAESLLNSEVDPTWKTHASYGGLEVKESNTDSYTYSCWATKGSVDLADEIVLPKGGDKFIDGYFAKNPIILYQHDWHQPIGNVRKFESSDEGLYFEEVKLTPIPVVRDVIWPLLKDKTLRGTSIGFYALDGKFNDAGIWVHEKWFLIENSLVSIPCNYDALVDSTKHLGGPVKDLIQSGAGDLKVLIAAYEAGQIFAKKSISLHVPESVEVEKIVATSPVKELHDQEGERVEPWNKSHEDFENVQESIHLMKRVLPDGTTRYLHKVGEFTKSGYRYSFEKAATVLCHILGARNPIKHTPAELKNHLVRMASVYEMLNKEFPSYEGVPLNKLKPESLVEITFDNVEFKQNERAVQEKQCLLNDMANIKKTIERITKGELPADAEVKEAVAKSMHLWVDFFGCIEGPKDAEKIAQIAALLFEEPGEVEEADGAVSIFNDAPAEVSLPDMLGAIKSLLPPTKGEA